jgi:hypothetical protein
VRVSLFGHHPVMPNLFSAESEAIVVQPFTFGGVAYKPGAPEAPTVFPHKRLGMPDIELHGLWRVGYIRFTGRPAEVGEEPKKPAAPAPSKPQKPAAQPQR